MHAATQTLNPASMPLRNLLGLDQEPHGPSQNNKFFYASALISQRLSLLKNIVGGHSQVIVVTGERGSGKTTLMNQYIADADQRWQTVRIRLKAKDHTPTAKLPHLDNRMVFVSKTSGKSLPSVIIDDAHQLSPREVKLLMQWTFSDNGPNRLQCVVLLAQPQIRKRYDEIAQWLPQKSIIDKIHMAPLTEQQTAAYLHHRLTVAGYSKLDPFTEDQIRIIHQLSYGLPGLINKEAQRLLEKTKALFSKNSGKQRWSLAFPWKRMMHKSLAYID